MGFTDKRISGKILLISENCGKILQVNVIGNA